MKRRTGNADAGKPPRRQSKRTAKFTDSVYGSSYIYIKFFMVWAFIIFADFILEFRFEYLWPLWLLIQSCFETFKCQGLVYSMFFVCIAITSDTICFLFIPIQWLFFMASTYVWIHYVWHTEKGLCLPTALLWFVFMYVEATLRLKDLHNNPFHIELCRPFAAHCIGHPFVTLGIGFKSYISYRLRVRTQRQVQKENNFYYELLKGSLPASVQTANHTLAITGKDKGELPISNGGLHLPSKKNIHHNNNGCNEKRNHKDDCHQHGEMQQQATASSTLSSLRSASTSQSPTSKHHNNSTNNTTTLNSGGKSNKSVERNNNKHHHRRNNNNSSSTTTSTSSHNHEGGSNNDVAAVVTSSSSGKKKNGSRRSASQSSSSSELHSSSTNNSNHQRTNSTKSNSSPKSVKNQHHDTITEKPRRSSNKDTTTTTTTTLAATTTSLPNGHVNNGGVATTNMSKVELVSTPSLIEKLESTISKLTSEMNCLKKSDQESKKQIEVITVLEKSARNELKKLKEEHEFLQTKYQNLFSGKQKDKLSIQSMEKKLKVESENRTSVEKLLQEEIRRHKEEEETAKNAAAAISSKEKEECEQLRQLKKTLEAEMSTMHDNLKKKEEGYMLLKKEVTQREKSIKESETLMSALEAMQEKNAMLENSLSAETKIKLDLFSALGDAKRQLEIAHRMILKRDSEIADLKSRMTDMVSVMPNSCVRPSTPHYSTSFLEKPSIVRVNQEYQNTFCHPPRTPVPTQLAPAPMVQAAHNQLGVDQGGMVNHLHPIHLDPNALLYAPTTSAH